MKTRTLLGLAVLAGLPLGIIGTANAGSLTVQAAAGHVWNSTSFGYMVRNDGQVKGPPSTATGNYWAIPIPLSVTGVTYTGTQYSGTTWVSPDSRLVSFNSNGQVIAMSAWTSLSSIGSVYVPVDGTLFSQSYIDTTKSTYGYYTADSLATIKVTY
jgi:hypothetical protein